MSIVRNGRPGRPSVSVVMPFAGTRDEAWAAVEALGRLHLLDGDELLLADNAGVLAGAGGAIAVRASTGAAVVIAAARGERSPAHARNAGVAAARPDTEWILFLDADTTAPVDLIARYLGEPVDDDVGALAGAIVAAPSAGGRTGLAARYGAHKNFLDEGAHLAHPFMPRAAAANLLVRRAAFDWVGGFFEGLRAAEDTDFSWRLQRAGWRLIGRPEAIVEHRYRDSVTALRRQWRAYAAGRAWLGRRYEGFEPQPALVRAMRRALDRAPSTGTVPGASASGATASGATASGAAPPSALPLGARVAARDRISFAVMDGILGVEELLGFVQPNRPGAAVTASAALVLLAGRFPGRGVSADPGVRVEAVARPDRVEPAPSGVTVTYREDDGLAERAAALLRLGLVAPRPTFAALAHDPRAALELAPAAVRLRADPGSSVAAADPAMAQDVRRLARLAGREPRS
jgi:Glycosyl transferase family group 2